MPRSYAQLCGVASALDVIGDRWAILILRDLLIGPLRFGDLVEGLPGIGSNTLAARLKHLETAGVIRRQVLALPDRGMAYELTEYGHQLEPILMALGRWGTQSMDRLPSELATRSRWLVAAMLAFHDESRRIARPATWELRLTDGPFTVRAEGTSLTITAGPAEDADAVITTSDSHLHLLLNGRLTPADAVAAGTVTIAGDASALSRLLELVAFPPDLDVDP
jgi:DNA-binding HxlR family transcriptional regulator